MCNFRVGQKVVYIGQDYIFDPEPGKTIHTILSIRQACCDMVIIDVGKREFRPHECECTRCGSKEVTPIKWKSARLFRPLIDDYTDSEIAEVDISELTEELELQP